TSVYRLVSYFFFQAEDGIRDFHVTGVQTCALPISTNRDPESFAALSKLIPPSASPSATWSFGSKSKTGGSPTRRSSTLAASSSRSEERRVGKECRSRVSGYL